MDRRETIKTLAMGAAASLAGVMGGCASGGARPAVLAGPTGGCASVSGGACPEAGLRPDPDDWQLVFEDDFTGGSLDPSKWSTGWGWGHRSTNTAGEASPENVTVSDSMLHLTVTKGHGSLPYLVGAVNTKDKFTFGPGTYLEARVRALDLPGCNQAFWSKPNSEEWPPEIDFFEIPTKLIRRSIHNIHYSSSREVGDRSTHATYHNATRYLEGEAYSDGFHVFGCAWREDRIEHYADGSLIGTTDDRDVVAAVNRGAPFYLMFSTAVDQDWLGAPPDDWTGYDTTMEVDRVRAWTYSPQ